MDLNIRDIKLVEDGPNSSRSNFLDIFQTSNDCLFKSDSGLKQTLFNSKEEVLTNNEIAKENSTHSPKKRRIKSQKEKLLYFLTQEKTKSNKKELNFIPKKLEFKIQEPQKKERKDVFGTIINKKNKKNVKVTFNDEIGDNNLVTEIEIESFKKYNLILGMPKGDYYGGENKKNAECRCCIIF